MDMTGRQILHPFLSLNGVLVDAPRRSATRSPAAAAEEGGYGNGGGGVDRPDVRQAVTNDQGAVPFTLKDGFGEYQIGGSDEGFPIGRKTSSGGSGGGSGNYPGPPAMCTCGNRQVPCSELTACKGTTMDPRLDKPREMIIWPPTNCGGGEDGVEFLRRLKEEFCFTKICFKFDRFQNLLNAIEAGWDINDIILNVDCCHACDHHVCDNCANHPNWGVWPQAWRDNWREVFLEICDLTDEIWLIDTREQFINKLARRGMANNNDRVGIFYDKYMAGEIDCEYDCPNPSVYSLESMLKIAKTKAYNKLHGTSKAVSCNRNENGLGDLMGRGMNWDTPYDLEPCDVMTEADYKSIPGFWNYYFDEPGFNKDERCRSDYTGITRCNIADITTTMNDMQYLDETYNTNHTPVTIGDYRFTRVDFFEGFGSDNESGLYEYANIADAVSYGGPGGRGRLGRVFNEDVEFATIVADQRYSWTVMADQIVDKGNTTMMEYSYPWIYSPGTKAGDDAGEYTSLVGHAMNEKFHTLGYYGLEWKGSCDEFLNHLKSSFIPTAICAGWLVGNR